MNGNLMAEHARIAQFLAPLTASDDGAFKLQNDAAALEVPAGKKLIITTDSVIASIHLPAHATAEQLVRKLFRRNISDLAAMGAMPWRYTLNLHLPSGAGEAWWQACSGTLASEQSRYGMVLVGGDCSSAAEAAPHLSATFFGLCDTPLSRSGAQVGDGVYVTGSIGDAALYLQTQQPDFVAAYDAPEPPIVFAQHLAKYVTSCIDISDGLLADAAHIALASNVGITIQHADIPLSNAAERWLKTHPEHTAHMFAGDDYQLLFTAPEAQHRALVTLAETHGIRVRKIGVVHADEGVQLVAADGEAMHIGSSGYQHA